MSHALVSLISANIGLAALDLSDNNLGKNCRRQLARAQDLRFDTNPIEINLEGNINLGDENNDE